MTIGQVRDAERKALHELDKWNSVTGFIQEGTSYWYEMQAVIEDSVHIGIQMALYGKVEYDKEGSVVKQNLTSSK